MTASLHPTLVWEVARFLVAVDQDTVNYLNGGPEGANPLRQRYIDGTRMTGELTNYIRTDQGLNTTKLDNMQQLSAELREQQYLIQIDNRLGRVYDVGAGDGVEGSPAFIDDDQIASYYVTLLVGGYVSLCKTGPLGDQQGVSPVGGAGAGSWWEVLNGPRGTKLMFSLLSTK